MADTGAPWNLPYPLPTDLVRDGADAIKDLAEATADGLDAAGGVLQVKHSFLNTTFSTTSTTFVDVTNMEVTITPTSTSNKVLCFVNLPVHHSGDNFVGARLLRGSTVIADNPGIDGFVRTWPNRFVSTSDFSRLYVMPGSNGFTFLDDPATDTATTYKVQIRTDSGTAYVNFTSAGGRAVSSITVMEVRP